MTNISVESVTVPVPVVYRWREMPPYFRPSLAYTGSFEDGFLIGSISDKKETGEHRKLHGVMNPVAWEVLEEFRFMVNFSCHVNKFEDDSFIPGEALKMYCPKARFVGMHGTVANLSPIY